MYLCRIACRHFIVCIKWLARLSIFIHADILLLVSEFIVVVILSEWLSVLTTVGTFLVSKNLFPKNGRLEMLVDKKLLADLEGNHRNVILH